MKSIIKTSLILALIVSATPLTGVAQTLDESLVGLRSPSETERIKAFYFLLYGNTSGSPPAGGSFRPYALRTAERAQKNDALARALIALAAQEQSAVRSAKPGSLSEVYISYYGDVIGTVAFMKDPRAVDVLIGAIETGRLATDGLVELGETAVGRLLATASSDHPLSRSAATRVLGKMVARAAKLPMSQSAVASIRLSLLRSLSDSIPFVRISAIDALSAYTDAEVRAAIVRISEVDTYSTRRDGRLVFPVREAAKQFLHKNSNERIMK